VSADRPHQPDTPPQSQHAEHVRHPEPGRERPAEQAARRPHAEASRPAPAEHPLSRTEHNQARLAEPPLPRPGDA
jgi:hypothetical protein